MPLRSLHRRHVRLCLLSLIPLLLIQLGLPAALRPRQASAQTRTVVLAAATNAANPAPAGASEATILTATLSGFTAPTYQWLRSTSRANTDYAPITADASAATGPTQYLPSSNQTNDVGYAFKLRVTQDGVSYDSNAVAIGPETPKLIHPKAETVYVRHPHFNVKKVGDPETGLYIYDTVVWTETPARATVASADNDPVLTERQNNHDITYWRFPTVNLEPSRTYYWKARARLGNVVGPWSEPVAFTMTQQIWSDFGSTWHWPVDANSRLAGTFMEAHHGGELGTGIHGGIDISQWKPDANGTQPNNPTSICGQPVRAARSGKLDLATGRVRLIHEQLIQNHTQYSQTHYLHMRSLTTLPLGTLVNQGAQVGVMSNYATVACHLHFNVSNYVSGAGEHDSNLHYNPLLLRYDGWNRPEWGPLRVTRIYLRSGTTIGSNERNIGDNVRIIVQTVDPALNAPPGTGTQLAPYRVHYYVSSAGEDPVHTIQFDHLRTTDRENHFYPPEAEGSETYYRLHGRWNSANLPENAGPQTIRVVAWDIEAIHPEARANPAAPFVAADHTASRTLRIGPEWPEAPVVIVNPCGPDTQRVNVQLFNRNSNIHDIHDDTYTLTMTRPANANNATVNAELVTNQLNILEVNAAGTGGSGTVRIDISKPFVNGTLHLVARSGILTNVRDAVDVQVQVAAGQCQLNQGGLEQQGNGGGTFGMQTPVFGMQVGDNARFNLGAYPDPLSGEETGASWSLSYGWPNRPGTSFSSFRVDGTDYIYGTDGSLLAPSTNLDRLTNSSSWMLGDVEVSQVLELPPAGQTGEQLATIRYTVRNTGDVPRSVGARVLLDTEVANADGFGYQTEDGVLTAEQALTGSAIPESFNVLSAEDNATHQALAVLKEEGELAPDRLVFAPWSQLARVKYNYTVTPGRPLSDDGAYAVYWDASPLEPGETRTYVTYYGLAQVDAASIASAAMALAVSASEGQGG